MRPFIVHVSAALLLLVATEARSDSSVSGPSTAYLSSSSVVLTGSTTAVAQVTIPKGKPKRVLQVEVQATELTSVIQALGIYAVVNGVPLEPQGFGNIQVTGCDSTTHPNCTFLAHFWADLDQYETSHPGTFKKQPLVIDVMSLTDGPTATFAFTVRARMIKK